MKSSTNDKYVCKSIVEWFIMTINKMDIKKNKENVNNYILITPAKDEETCLPGLIASVRAQDSRPCAWIIIDDGSSDRTSEIIRAAEASDSWIHGIFLESRTNYNIEEHYAEICTTGFDYGLKYISDHQLPCDFIALSDADMIYSKDYFNTLSDFLISHPDYGLISGALMIKDDRGNIYQENKVLPNNDIPLGTGRMWRISTFIETGGYLKVRAPDTVSYILAVLHGWKTTQLPDLICYQSRDTGSKINIWQGYVRKGERAYYLNSNILSIFNTVVDFIVISRQKDSLKKSLALVVGYFSSYFHHDTQIPDAEVRRYMGSYKKTFKTYIQLIKRLKSPFKKSSYY